MRVRLSGQEPFPCASDGDVLETYVMSGVYEFDDLLWDRLSPEAKDLVMKMMTTDPKKRLTVKEALKHPWIQERERSLGVLYQNQVLGKWNRPHLIQVSEEQEQDLKRARHEE
jgi:calcium-dependent protein kinase